jgi:hypothetical protein
MPLITLLAGSVVAVVFGWGGLAKLVRFREWQEALGAYRLPLRTTGIASLLVPIGELTVVALLVLDHALAGAALTLTLLAAFSLALLDAHQEHGDRLPCGCFGRATPHDYRLLVARNGGLAFLAGIVLIGGRDRLISDTFHAPTSLVPALLVVVGLSIVLWVGRELSGSLRRQ